MKGMELSKQYYEACGKPMIHALYPEWETRIAVGIAGSGSECFGYDDGVSQDHDFLPGFYLWLTEEDAGQIGPSLAEAYDRLPKAYGGIALCGESLGREKKFGVMTIGHFLQQQIGLTQEPQNWRQWLYLPEHAMATVVNGELFRDDSGTFSRIREAFCCGMPEDVRLKKIAGRLALMAQSGQYNYHRCLLHGEREAARLALYEFINHTFFVAAALNRRYLPFYKWRFRFLRGLKNGELLSDQLAALIHEREDHLVRQRIEEICRLVRRELNRQSLSSIEEPFLEQQALEVTKRIQEPEIRQLHLMECGE